MRVKMHINVYCPACGMLMERFTSHTGLFKYIRCVDQENCVLRNRKFRPPEIEVEEVK